MQTGNGSNFCIITNLVATATEIFRSFEEIMDHVKEYGT
jgi:hypothetical protein